MIEGESWVLLYTEKSVRGDKHRSVGSSPSDIATEKSVEGLFMKKTDPDKKITVAKLYCE